MAEQAPQGNAPAAQPAAPAINARDLRYLLYAPRRILLHHTDAIVAAYKDNYCRHITSDTQHPVTQEEARRRADVFIANQFEPSPDREYALRTLLSFIQKFEDEQLMNQLGEQDDELDWPVHGQSYVTYGLGPPMMCHMM